LDICQVPVHSDVLPSVCPDTPKYLEAQYQCVSHIKVAEEVCKRRLPRLGVNISDVWSDRNVMLNDDFFKDALETVIDSQVPITEEPTMLSSEFGETSDESTAVNIINGTSVNSLRYFYSFNDTSSLNNSLTKTNPKENTTSLPLSMRNSPLSDNNCVNKNRCQWTTKEVLIIILISSLSVILIIISVATLIIKVKKKGFKIVNILQLCFRPT
jgi:hypothetical protein